MIGVKICALKDGVNLHFVELLTAEPNTVQPAKFDHLLPLLAICELG